MFSQIRIFSGGKGSSCTRHGWPSRKQQLQVGLAGLCTAAFQVIQSQLDENNIVQELFSPFAAQWAISDSRRFTDLILVPFGRHKGVREMEHELFQSRLKPLVDRALISDIIESSSSGGHPHRTAAMELVIERSIQGRRERMLAKAKSAPQPAPAPQPKNDSETPRVSIPKVTPPATAPAPRPKRSSETMASPIQKVEPPAPAPSPTPQPLPGLFDPAYAKTEAPPDSSSSPKPPRGAKAARHVELPADTKVNPPPSEVIVELVCEGCRVKYPRKSLWSDLYCPSCPESSDIMRCVGCGAIRAKNVRVCTRCHGKFK